MENITRSREDMNFMFADRVTKTLLFLQLDHKLHIFKLTCNVIFIIWMQTTEDNRKHTESRIKKTVHELFQLGCWNLFNISPFLYFV